MKGKKGVEKKQTVPRDGWYGQSGGAFLTNFTSKTVEPVPYESTSIVFERK